MRYREFAPPPALVPYLRCVWVLDACADRAAGADPVVPDGCVEIVLNFGDRFRRFHDSGEIERQSSALIVGQLTRAVTIAPEGAISLVGVRFQPWGAAPLLGVSAAELRDRMVRLEDHQVMHRLLARVGDGSGPESRAALAFAALDELVSRGRPPWAAAPRAVALASSGSTLSVRGLATALGTTTRTVQQSFCDEIGMAPKSLMRLARLHRAVACAHDAPERTLSRVAVEAGYFDHAHLARDCRDIVGVTPTELLSRTSVLTNVFLEGNRRAGAPS